MGLSKGVEKANKAMEKALAGKYDRRDLSELVQTRYTKSKTSFRKKKIVVKSRRAPRKD